MSLIRAVEKFDFSRGNKFSTYASWAIMKNFARTIPEENYRRDRFVTGHEEMFEAAADNRTDEHEYESALKRMQEAVKGMLGRLDDRERQIIVSRFGLGGVERADAGTARPRARDHQGTGPPDRVARPGKTPQDRRRTEARFADACVRYVSGYRSVQHRGLRPTALADDTADRQIGSRLANVQSPRMAVSACDSYDRLSPDARVRLRKAFFGRCGKALQHGVEEVY